MDLRKAIEVLERNLRVGSGNLRNEHKPQPHKISEATRIVIIEAKKKADSKHCRSCDVITGNEIIITCKECGGKK